MVSSSRAVSNDENVNPLHSVRRHHDTNARRQRRRLQSTNLNAPARSLNATREAARRGSRATPAHQLAPPTQIPAQHTPSLPAELCRPPFCPISDAAFDYIGPSLKGIPAVFIQRVIHDEGKDLFASACQTVTHIPTGEVPLEMDVVINNVSVDPPTHVVAVYSRSSSLQNRPVSLHPIHQLFLAANCAHLPPLPASRVETPELPGSIVTLPVVPLIFERPETFNILVEYLYTHNQENLQRALLPLAAFGSIPPPAKLARELVRTCPTVTLQMTRYRLYALYGIVTTLGVFDQPLWRMMEVAWQVLRDALTNQATLNS
ncbi:hypothetical protein JB92DRAFT_2795890 [Gautieria morchelliformis]|nr:hypothetical protein JB92DRAFT_2795890 [Gautieria morchelliformis]